jgi:hypothetical protein
VIEQIERREFADWHGLPPDAFTVPDDVSAWAQRPLGDLFEPARFRLLDLEGYYRPRISVRDGAVVLFDGAQPELDFVALANALGEPEAREDCTVGTLDVAGGEWIYAGRGLTLFVNSEPDRVLHIALYAPVSVDAYADRLRPHLAKTLRPR